MPSLVSESSIFFIHFWALEKPRAHCSKLEDFGECDISHCDALRNHKPYFLLKTVARINFVAVSYGKMIVPGV